MSFFKPLPQLRAPLLYFTTIYTNPKTIPCTHGNAQCLCACCVTCMVTRQAQIAEVSATSTTCTATLTTEHAKLTTVQAELDEVNSLLQVPTRLLNLLPACFPACSPYYDLPPASYAAMRCVGRLPPLTRNRRQRLPKQG